MPTPERLSEEDEADHPLYAAYDGRLKLSWPDDLYLIGSAEALIGLRRAIDRALTRRIGQCTGLCSDESPSKCLPNDLTARRVIVIKADPSSDRLAPELCGKPGHVPESERSRLLTLFDRRLAEEAESDE